MTSPILLRRCGGAEFVSAPGARIAQRPARWSAAGNGHVAPWRRRQVVHVRLGRTRAVDSPESWVESL